MRWRRLLRWTLQYDVDVQVDSILRSLSPQKSCGLFLRYNVVGGIYDGEREVGI